ncbi:hypothetical protein [Streptomyces sp. NPDC127072]|uniref:hypothetical protein n=1 Tax=Streptomyces sp. NPDC127072 TaxID=3347129 RepID=UPI003646999B
MATRKPPPRTKTTTPEPVKCGPCGGTGEVARTVRVGRKQRPVGQQAGICLTCLGTGNATD